MASSFMMVILATALSSVVLGVPPTVEGNLSIQELISANPGSKDLCLKDTGGTCFVLNCHANRGAECEGFWSAHRCLCKPGYCVDFAWRSGPQCKPAKQVQLKLYRTSFIISDSRYPDSSLYAVSYGNKLSLSSSDPGPQGYWKLIEVPSPSLPGGGRTVMLSTEQWPDYFMQLYLQCDRNCVYYTGSCSGQDSQESHQTCSRTCGSYMTVCRHHLKMAQALGGPNEDFLWQLDNPRGSLLLQGDSQQLQGAQGRLAQGDLYSCMRFKPTKMRGGEDVRAGQIASLDFLYAGGMPGDPSQVSGPGGNHTAGTWHDINGQPLLVRFEEPTRIDAFSFATADAAPERDPVRWLLEGSVAASCDMWTTVHSQIVDYETPTIRGHWLPWISVHGSDEQLLGSGANYDTLLDETQNAHDFFAPQVASDELVSQPHTLYSIKQGRYLKLDLDLWDLNVGWSASPYDVGVDLKFTYVRDPNLFALLSKPWVLNGESIPAQILLLAVGVAGMVGCMLARRIRHSRLQQIETPFLLG